MSIDIAKMSVDERLALIGDIWDSLDPADIPLTGAQRVELDRRLDDLDRDPNLGIPWEDVLQQIRNRAK